MKLNLFVEGCIALCINCLALMSCSKDEVIEKQEAPVVVFDNETGAYTVKVGRTLIISPLYKNVEDASYKWELDGKVVGTSGELAYSSSQVGKVFVTLTVSTKYGSTTEEVSIDVVKLEIPTVSLAGVGLSGGGGACDFTVLAGSVSVFSPVVVKTSIPNSYTWRLNGAEVAATKDYAFSAAETGEYRLSFTASNEDGEDTIEFKVRVCIKAEMPVGWAFEQTVLNVAKGRSVRLSPLDITNAFDAEYTWRVDGTEVQKGPAPAYIFNTAATSATGAHSVTVTIKAGSTAGAQTLTQALTVNVCPAEGAFYRPKTAASNPDFDKVYEFWPAPGQFVNGNYTASTPDEAVAYASKTLKAGGFVSLGAFGGYIVVGFDHSVDNNSGTGSGLSGSGGGDYDFTVVGNSFSGSSEPGIVWVMQDENGDGLPNDTWYELKGSESGKVETLPDYAVTYYKPRGAGMDVQWTDNQGNSGTLDYLPAYHNQPYYYPAWVGEESYTLRGTCLKARNVDQSGTGAYWLNGAYDWGYVDNFGLDRAGDDTSEEAPSANRFKISNAVTFDGSPANLKYIDFVKVQTGVNAKSGWIGELSTEVLGFKDFSLR